MITHLKSNTIADMTGTVTIFDSQGSTATVAATNLVRPSDWNSGHQQVITLAGNTAGASTLSGTNIVIQGSNNIVVSGVQGASVATIAISGSNQTQQPMYYSASGTSSQSNTIQFGNTQGISFSLSNGSIVGTVKTDYLTTAAQSDHSHGNPTLNLTNISGTTASASNGLTLSLSAAAPGGGAAATLSYFQNIENAYSTVTTALVGSTSHIQPLHLMANYSLSYLRIPVSFSVPSTTWTGSAAATSFSASILSSVYVVIYSLGTGANSYRLQSVASGSVGFSQQYSVGQNTSSTNTSRTFSISQVYTFPGTNGITTSYSTSTTGAGITISFVTGHLTLMTGLKYVNVPFVTSLSMGDYWICLGYNSTTSTQAVAALTGGRVTVSNCVVSQANATVGFLGSTALNSIPFNAIGHGSFTTNAIGTTASLNLSNITSAASHGILLVQGFNF